VFHENSRPTYDEVCAIDGFCQEVAQEIVERRLCFSVLPVREGHRPSMTT
jgi:hypothetical protein